MGAEKWLDIELWTSTKECFDVLKSRGYRIATTHVGMDAVSIDIFPPKPREFLRDLLKFMIGINSS